MPTINAAIKAGNTSLHSGDEHAIVNVLMFIVFKGYLNINIEARTIPATTTVKTAGYAIKTVITIILLSSLLSFHKVYPASKIIRP